MKGIQESIRGYYESNGLPVPVMENDLDALGNIYESISTIPAIDVKVERYHKWVMYFNAQKDIPMAVLKTLLLVSKEIDVDISEYAFVWFDRQILLARYLALKTRTTTISQ